MPTPARAATAEMGAPGSAVNTARAASRMRRSLRAAWARRPLSGAVVVSLMQRAYHILNGSFRSAILERNGSFREQRPTGPRSKEATMADGTDRSETPAAPAPGADRPDVAIRPFQI